MIEEGQIYVDERDGIGMCPLMFAVDCEFSLAVIRKLIDFGCSPYSVDDSGDTLLHYAVNLQNKELEEMLLNEYRLSKEIENNDGLTPY